MLTTKLNHGIMPLTNYVTKRFRLVIYLKPILEQKSMLGACESLYTRNHYVPEEKYGSRSYSSKVNIFGINFDRRIKVSHEDSMNYMNSKAYKLTYGEELVWRLYRRNSKGHRPSKLTRENCINEEGFLSTSHPCPICRDEYLVLHRDNSKLLEQFLNPHTGELYLPKETGLCQKQNRNLVIAYIQAKDYGTISHPMPDRLYDYSEYYQIDDIKDAP